MKRLTAIDLFCGAGGLSKGFEMAGYDILLGMDNDKWSIETFNRNHKGRGILADIRLVKSKDIMEKIGLKPGELFVIIGSPPCQGFSRAGKRNPSDSRNQLYKEFLRLVKEIQPKWVVMENVEYLKFIKFENGKRFIDIIVKDFEKIGFKIRWEVLNSADYGVPQIRKRIIFVGNRIEKPIIFPKKTHLPELKGQKSLVQKNKYITVKEAISDLCSSNIKISNHESPKISGEILKRLELLKEGQWVADLPSELQPKKVKPHCGGGEWFSGRFRRLNSRTPSRTIVATTPFFHYKENRYITVRECARIQSFPDNFIFTGSLKSQYRQVGNAVPPPMAKKIAESIGGVLR